MQKNDMSQIGKILSVELRRAALSAMPTLEDLMSEQTMRTTALSPEAAKALSRALMASRAGQCWAMLGSSWLQKRREPLIQIACHRIFVGNQ
ncbi:hypothetical protein [Ruegeria lacuscaerulensis]|uniref:hypothetical protein n=1 Tax=Ruegeria lacuscaerulensis TaxID=55218 RepID=UPI00147D3607|nr:hypothetical protein [Ruegeria lacuscaerulensis]